MSFVEQKPQAPFRLVRYFTLASLIMILIGSIALSLLNTQWVKSIQVSKNETYALSLVENLNHQIQVQFALPMVREYGRIQLSNPNQYAVMDTVVHGTMVSFKVARVTIYDMANTVAYSYDKDIVGQEGLGGHGYQLALAGTSSSKIQQKGSWFEIFFGIPKESKLVTYAPLRIREGIGDISGPVTGVIEIIQDLETDNEAVFKFQRKIVFVCCGIMLLLLSGVLWVLSRGERFYANHAKEQIRLKEALEQSRHLSSLGTMTAGISHEIRNPLGIIRSSAELLKRKIDQGADTGTLPDIIIEEASRLNTIITNFLNFAKPLTPTFAKCYIEDVIEKIISAVSIRIDEHNCHVVKSFEKNIPAIWADADILYQAMLNILLNSIQAMPEGGTIYIDITTDRKNIQINLRDEGTGIPEEILEKIWDPFFTSKEKGTGLGLGIVRKIIFVHGGQIDIQNCPQGGACASILLPVLKVIHGKHSDR